MAPGKELRYVPACETGFNKHHQAPCGLPVQASSHSEAKLVRCIKGVIGLGRDLLPGSPTFGMRTREELSAGTHDVLYIREGAPMVPIAHVSKPYSRIAK